MLNVNGALNVLFQQAISKATNFTNAIYLYYLA